MALWLWLHIWTSTNTWWYCHSRNHTWIYVFILSNTFAIINSSYLHRIWYVLVISWHRVVIFKSSNLRLLPSFRVLISLSIWTNSLRNLDWVFQIWSLKKVVQNLVIMSKIEMYTKNKKMWCNQIASVTRIYIPLEDCLEWEVVSCTRGIKDHWVYPLYFF